MENSNFTENLKQVLYLAEKLAEAYGSSYIASEHLLFGMLIKPECKAYKILSVQGITAEKYEGNFVRTIDSGCIFKGYTPRTKLILQAAEQFGRPTRTEHLLNTIANNDSCLAVRILRCMGTDFLRLFKDVEYSLNSETEQ